MQASRKTTTLGAAIVLAIGLLLVVASTLVSRSADDDKGILASLLSQVLSTPTTTVSIGAVEGALSSDSTIRDIAIADRDGVWLRLDRVRLVWRRTALLARRLEVDRLEIGTLQVLRRPLPPEQEVKQADTPILPELPLKLVVKDFSLRELVLGPSVVGTAARVAATGAATLGDPSEGLSLRFDARRLDAPGTLAARLELVPRTQRLDLTVAGQEPAGGILVHALQLPGLPPAKLELNGSGTLDAFTAQLAFEAGENIGATGSAQLRREAAARRLSLDLAARIEGLLPAPTAPAFAGVTKLDGSITFADTGAVRVEPLAVTSQTAQLDVRGGLSADRLVDLRISARTLPNAGDKTAAGGAEIGKFVFDATFIGPLMGPRIEATLEAEKVASPHGRLEKIAAKVTASPSGSVLESSTSIPFTAEARASGVALTDPALARALGSSISLTLAGNARDGVADLQTARLETATSNIRFTGRIGKSVLQGRVLAAAPDLARFRDLASLQLRGALNLTADLAGAPWDGRIEATIDARATDFATGIVTVDRLAGTRLNVNGTVRKLPRGGYGFGNFRITGEHASGQIDGEATVQQAGIDARLTIPDLKRVDERLSGRGEVRANLTGTVERPDATANVVVTDASALGRPIPRLVLEVAASDITGMLNGQAKLSGTVDGKPAEGVLRLAKQPGGGWRLGDLDVRIGSVTLQGWTELSASNLAEGRLTIDARDLDDLSPIVLTKLSGRLQAEATLAISGDRQDGTLTAQAQNVKVGEAALTRLTAQAQVTDVYRHPILDADIAIDRARVGGESISKVRLIAKGAPDASALSLTAQARGFSVDARGRLVPADRIRLELSTLTARRGQHRLVLVRPTTFTLRDEGVDIESLALALDRGRLSVNGRVGETLDLNVTASSVPLSVSGIVMPSLGLSGTLNGEAKVTGRPTAPTGTWRVRVEQLVAPQTRNAGLHRSISPQPAAWRIERRQLMQPSGPPEPGHCV